jgi:hypothetical protein
MNYRDRGIKKWQQAFFMPEQFSKLRKFWNDSERITKPILDQYQVEEFDNKIGYAIEFNLPVKLTLWVDGFTKDIIGRLHHVDSITHQLIIEVKPGEFQRIKFEHVTKVCIVE